MLIVVGDALQRGGAVLSGSPHTDIDGRAVARVGDKVLCTRHGAGAIVTGDPTLLIDGQAVARNGDKASCGCVLLAGRQQLAHIADGDSGIGRDLLRGVSPMRWEPRADQPKAPPAQPATGEQPTSHCWMKDLVTQVKVDARGRYFESYGTDGSHFDDGVDWPVSFRLDVPLKSGGDITVTIKMKIKPYELVPGYRLVSDKEIQEAKRKIWQGLTGGLNGRFKGLIDDPQCGTCSFAIRYAIEYVEENEDCVLDLRDEVFREHVDQNIIVVDVQTGPWTYVHELMHCLGLPDEYMDDGKEARILQYFMPNGMPSEELVRTKGMGHDEGQAPTLMSEEHSAVLEPRHVWNVGIEVTELLRLELGREVTCVVS